jgi:hypothetical protein
MAFNWWDCPTNGRLGKVNAPVLAAAVVTMMVGLALAGCDSSSGLSGKSAAQVLPVATAAANVKASAHVESSALVGDQTLTSVSDISRTEGTQTTSGAGGSSVVFVVGGVAYQKGDAAFLEGSEGFPAAAASALAGRWISFDSGDAGFGQLSSGVTLSSALTEATPTGTLTLLKRSTVDGQAVVGITGGLAADAAESGVTGTQVLYVAEGAPHLPVQAVMHELHAGQSGTATLTFSRWGEKVSVIAPPGALPISTLTSPSS